MEDVRKLSERGDRGRLPQHRHRCLDPGRPLAADPGRAATPQRAADRELTEFIREPEPAGVTVSIGGEIGEVGQRNWTVEDLHAFMTGYMTELQDRERRRRRDLAGISKISVQTGTSHGGVVLPDGTIAEVAVDFETLGRSRRRRASSTAWAARSSMVPRPCRRSRSTASRRRTRSRSTWRRPSRTSSSSTPPSRPI